MKFVRYEHNGTFGYGVFDNKEIYPLDTNPFETYSISDSSIQANKVRILSPCLPSKALCIGLNYRDHAEEMRLTLPTAPVVFMKPSSSVIGPQEAIVYPSMSKRLDYEAELVIVMRKSARHVAEKDVDDYILGYTCGNDVTARDLQPQDGQWTVSKGFDTFMPLGPYIDTDVDPDNLAIHSLLNGTVKQSSNTSNLIFKCRYLVSYLSKVMTLYPHDVIMIGTPGGIGPMNAGDSIEIAIEGIGSLVNPIIKE